MALTATNQSPRRFRTNSIRVGNVNLGGDNPIVVQSMTTSDTMDIEATVQQSKDLVKAGCQVVRITAPTVQDAEALKTIKDRLKSDGIDVPIVADIHFLPAAAMVAADFVEKVRINPGNYADRKMFKIREYTDNEYSEEIERIHEKFKPLVLKIKEQGKAMRIGTNHGSLSDRIMNRFGDTPEGMIESAFEFADICRKYDFHNFCFSMKASNVAVMVKAYRLLVEKQLERGWAYPLHLGVTEAGDGEDGRLKSAIGIGTLLQEGMGDTIRVSLTEAAVKEIPVAKALAERFPRDWEPLPQGYSVRATDAKPQIPEVWMLAKDFESLKKSLESTKLRPDVIYFENSDAILNEIHMLRLQLKPLFGNLDFKIAVAVNADVLRDERLSRRVRQAADYVIGGSDIRLVDGVRELKSLSHFDPQNIIISATSESSDELGRILDVALQAGAAFVDLPLKGILIRDAASTDEGLRLSYGILQATRRRMSKTEYISCPSCGRTLFDLEETTARIKSVTSHLKGVKIAVMGCIVNGPGEMADADFGYVGGAPGRVNLYVGKDCVERNIPSAEAPGRLVDLIKKNDRWFEPTNP